MTTTLCDAFDDDAADAAHAHAAHAHAAHAMDKFRKDARKRELKRNKERRAEARTAAAQAKGVDALTAERERLARVKDAPAPPGVRVRADKIEEKIRFYDKQIEAKKASGGGDGGGGGAARGAGVGTRPTSTAYAVGAERFYKPEDSVYWHPTLNPSGKPPAGKPQKWKAGIEIDSRVGESRAALAAPEPSESESESDGDMPPPPGPPPGFELVFPDAPPREGATGDDEKVGVTDEEEDDDAPGPPPPGPPPPDEVTGDDNDGVNDSDDDDVPLPPPPMPPPTAVEPRITTVVHRAPMASMPRPQPPPRRPPPPQRRDAGFFAAPRAAVVKKPVDRAEFTMSAAPTATPTVRADQNPALRALVPASVRVKRQEAPEAKRQRTIGRAIDAAPAVAAAAKTAQDDKYLNFLDEMSSLGAFEE